VLWFKIEIELNDNGRRKIDYLVNSEPHGILDNLRKLVVSVSLGSNHSQKSSEANTNLLRLLGALPRDSLTSFRCLHFRLDEHVLGILLRRHSRLTKLEVCVNEKKEPTLPSINYVQGNLCNSQSLVIRPLGRHSNTYQGLSIWFPHMSKLRKLAVKGMRYDTPNHFAGWTLPAQAPPIRLRKLKLRNLKLHDSTADMNLSIDLPHLERFDVTICTNVELLLHCFAKSFGEFGSALKDFRCHGTISEETRNACEDLFRSVATLKSVQLGAHKGGHLPRIQSLHKNSQSLKQLTIYTWDMGSPYPTSEIHELVAQFSDLLTIGLNLVDLTDIIDEMEILESFDISRASDFTASLVSNHYQHAQGLPRLTIFRTYSARCQS
jgi:hypothetical protein